MFDDLRQALRSISKQPGFTAVAILTLAFGIGVNTTIFSIVSGLFLQPLHAKAPEQLVVVMQRGQIINVPYGYSYPDYLDFRKSVSAFDDMAAFMPTPVHVSTNGQAAERTWIEVVSPNYFELAGVTAAFGELLRAGVGESKGAAPVIVLSHRYWERRFGGNPAIVGQPIKLNGQSFTVIGIAPASFTGLSWAMAVSGFVPSGALGTLMRDGDAFRENRGAPGFRLMGRLAPGKTVSDARAEINVVAGRLATTFPTEHEGSRPIVVAESRARPDPTMAEVVPVIAAVFVVMVSLVLFIACANVANLMIARALERQRDLVIRSALGASRYRLVRYQIIEGLVLAAIAGAVGLVLAHIAGNLLQTFTPSGDMPVNDDQPSDWRVYVFTFVVSAIAGVATAIWPARQASRFNLVESLKDGARGAGTAKHRLRNLLVVGQVALSLIVLASAGLFVHSLTMMRNLALGFRTAGVLTMSVDLGLQQYTESRGRQFIDDVLQKSEALPGVASATVAAHVPLAYGLQVSDVGIDGPIAGTKDGYLSIAYNAVGPRFLETTGARLLKGRGLERTDSPDGRRVGLVNETMARTLWPGQDAIGKRFRLGRDAEWFEVVGIVEDGKYVTLGEQPRPYFYVPIAQRYLTPFTLIVRARTDPAPLVSPLRRVVRDVDSDLPVFDVRTMEAHVRESVFGLMPLRMGAYIAGAQGLVGLFLAVMGLYAVVSYAVMRRTREIGIRMALGAESRDVLRLVVRDGLRLTAIGVGFGLLGATAVGLILSRVLYGVQPMDAGVYVGVTLLLLAVAALACYVPARRATRVDPLIALRSE
jgi:predicted permease